ncbi:DUF4434 domain-containing protein [Eubacteriales bacterium OttesenSCG-928-G02]|nr:DUF4434 domain-containing protein [Eubacteriales bacterium OttesenSCG-928-G02]
MTGCNDINNNNSDPENTSSETDSQIEKNIDLALGAPYFYGYGISVENDKTFTSLTDGEQTNTYAVLKTNLATDDSNTFEMTFNDWYNKTHTVDVKNNYAVITVDLGFICDVKSFELIMDYEGDFKHIDIFTSTDGYNFTNYAGRADMEVYLGTIHDSNFTDPNQYFNTYSSIVNDGKLLIQDINDLYGDHPAFTGYYLSDETCDAWLNISRGVEAARYVYKGQSDLIREIAPDKKIMIAPAIWRSGSPVKGGELLYELIKPEDNNGKPIVDIVAAQDCLGREPNGYVTDDAYKAYIKYAQEWAIGIRKAGAEFWHDAEVFEILYTSKRYDDLIDSLYIEAPLSGSIIVFDIPHYFSIYSLYSYNDKYGYYKNQIMRDYIKYYCEHKQFFEK